MSLELNSSLKLICNEISNKCASSDFSYRFEFTDMLETTTAVERFLIAKYFCTLNWNIGSLRVLAILQEVRLVTATEYILCLDDAEQTQLILNDFLEAEYELLANLFASAYNDTKNAAKISGILDECLRRLFTDLLQKPNLNELKYLKVVKETLPNEVLQKIAQKHIDILLELHSSSIEEAFRNFSSWINEGVDVLKLTKDLYKELICYNETAALLHLLKISTWEHFTGWKFYLILLQTISSRCSDASAALVRKHLKTRLHHIAEVAPSKLSMLHLLLTVRAFTASSTSLNRNIVAYADWYKQNVGDMKFVLKTDEFRNIITLLEECICYESEEYYLDMHATISISPPVFFSKAVQAYKAKCKQHLSQIKAIAAAAANGVPAEKESIIIEDSD